MNSFNKYGQKLAELNYAVGQNEWVNKTALAENVISQNKW